MLVEFVLGYHSHLGFDLQQQTGNDKVHWEATCVSQFLEALIQ